MKQKHLPILRSISCLAVLACLFSNLTGCASNPVSGNPEFVLMSEEKELEIGKQMHGQIIAQSGVYPDPDLQAYVNEIGQKLASTSERPDLEWTFTILDDDIVNAFALPGGYVYITRGILAHLNSEAQLASVLGHEIGHVTARHAISRDRSNKLVGLATIVGTLATGAPLAGQAAGVVGAAMASGFSRSQELEADRLGAKYIAQNGYPTDAVFASVELLKRREQFEIERARVENRKPNIPHGLFATHPDNDVRFAEAVEAASAYSKGTDLPEGRESYLDRINGLRWGSRDVSGVVRDNYYYHGQFGIKLKFPEDWRVSTEKGKIEAIAGSNDAALQLFVVVPGRDMEPKDVIGRKLGLSQLRDAKEVTIAGMPAMIATGDRYVGPFGPRPVRAAAILDERSRRAYVFAGTGRHDLSKMAADGDFIASIFSFDRMESVERSLSRPPTIKVVRAEDGLTVESLAKESAVPVFAEQQIRLLNGWYPAGQPTPGELIKTVD